MEEYDTDSLIDDVKNYSNLLKLINDDKGNYNLIKEYVYDYQCMHLPFLVFLLYYIVGWI